MLYIEERESEKGLTLPLWLLKAIAEMTKAQASEGIAVEKIEFTPNELEDWLKNNSDKRIKSNDSSAKYISDLFGKLRGKSLNGNTRIESIAAENKYAFYGSPGKTEGGGARNTNLYRLDANIVREHVHTSVCKVFQYPLFEGGLRYREQKQFTAPFLISLLDNYHVQGWRLWLLLAFILLPIFLLITVFTLPALVIVAPVIAFWIPSVTMFCIVYLIVIISFFGFLYRLIDKRVAMAPEWMTITSKERLLLEYRAERDSSNKITHRKIVLVHYDGRCPVCKGNVTITSGRWHFIGRLVGKCSENPVEHIFSFDHVTQTGKPLR